ncbi:MAG: amidohydrolase [Candidatus Nanopelagicales bacterium]
MGIDVDRFPVEALGDLPDMRIDPDLLHVARAMVEHRSGELIYTRRWLHARPEVSRAEHETTAALRERLMVEGLKPRVLSVGTGLICDIGEAGPMVALRADIDALAMDDAKDVPYASLNAGVCHACGHDVHTAVVLGAGLVLHQLIGSGRVPGRVRLIFEPSEESLPGGALDVIKDGGLDSVDAIFGVHCDPKIDAGHLGFRIGALTSASHHMAISMFGPGGHTARPALTVNLADEVARVVRELPGAVQAEADALSGGDAERGEVRVVFGTIHTGSASNVIPAEAELTGSVRTPDAHVSDALLTILPRVLARLLGTDLRPEADGHRGSRPDGLAWVLSHQPGVTPVRNDPEATRTFARAALLAGGPDAACDTPHSWGGDTFGWYQDHVPGCYARLGTHWPGRRDHLDLHRPTFDVDEASIPFGTTALVLAAIGWLTRTA